LLVISALYFILFIFLILFFYIQVHRHSFLFWVLEMTMLDSIKTFSSAEDSGLLSSCTL